MNETQRYAEIKIQISALEAEAKMIYPKVLKEVEAAGGLDTAYGKFTLVERRKWEYTDKVTKLADKLKIAKISEEESGTATCTTQKSITFKQAKL